MYNFLPAENLASSELLENLNVAHKKLNQSKNGVVLFDFEMKLGSTSVKSSDWRENLLYVPPVDYRDRKYKDADELLCAII